MFLIEELGYLTLKSRCLSVEANGTPVNFGQHMIRRHHGDGYAATHPFHTQ